MTGRMAQPGMRGGGRAAQGCAAIRVGMAAQVGWRGSSGREPQWFRSTLISPFLSSEDRPLMPISAARSRNWSTVQSS